MFCIIPFRAALKNNEPIVVQVTLLLPSLQDKMLYTENPAVLTGERLARWNNLTAVQISSLLHT